MIKVTSTIIDRVADFFEWSPWWPQKEEMPTSLLETPALVVEGAVAGYNDLKVDKIMS